VIDPMAGDQAGVGLGSAFRIQRDATLREACDPQNEMDPARCPRECS